MKITPRQKKNINKIAKKHRLELVMLFGSFASGENRKDSDLDIAVLGKNNISLRKTLAISRELSFIFEKEVDLSVMNQANPLLLHQVEQNAILLSGRDEKFFEFKLRAFRRYHDYAPYFEMETRLNRELIKQYASR
ncbi:MAG: hypothetical protein A3J76_03045 [Candidatus Moranbacteria bacterium RBG_13_45_13]|nr:MAG: hypothetical protein A3J76_03045 [Candidatus Moranbacteria bacterium RBG_13_45_13]